MKKIVIHWTVRLLHVLLLHMKFQTLENKFMWKLANSLNNWTFYLFLMKVIICKLFFPSFAFFYIYAELKGSECWTYWGMWLLTYCYLNNFFCVWLQHIYHINEKKIVILSVEVLNWFILLNYPWIYCYNCFYLNLFKKYEHN